MAEFTLVFALDTDLNSSTGDTSYAEANGMGPDVELAYIVRKGQSQAELRLYGVATLPPLGDASALVEWNELDEVRLQATVAPALVSASSFYLLGDLRLADRYDRVPDAARVLFPERRLDPR